MKIDKKIIEEAKQIRYEASLKWGCSVKEIDFPSCVGMALKGEEMPKELPKLQGSEKQITWAETLRKEKMKELDKIEEKMEAHKPKNEKQEKGKKWGQEAIKRMREETSASWFIDHRDTRAYYILHADFKERVGKENK